MPVTEDAQCGNTEHVVQTRSAEHAGILRELGLQSLHFAKTNLDLYEVTVHLYHSAKSDSLCNMEYLLISKLDVKHYPLHLWTPGALSKYWAAWSQLARSQKWKDAGANSVLGGTAKERAGRPAYQV